ncbi:MAG: ferritin [Actinomycetota bacterium]
MLNDNVAAALNAHMGREFSAHLQYLSLASYFAGEGLPELAAFFYAQADEEHDHAMRFLHFVSDAGGTVKVPALPAPPTGFEGAEDAVSQALHWEEAVTRHIHDLVDLAAEHRDHATSAFLQWFVTEQVEEVATMSELLQVVRRAGEANILLVEDYIARTMARGGRDGRPE